MNRHVLMIGVVFIMLLLNGCGAPASDQTPLLEKDTDFDVIFYGDGCQVTGPSEVSAGEDTFKFIQNSDLKGELWLISLDEGKTIQDLLDGQSEPGEWYPKPAWADYDKKGGFEYETVEGTRVIISTWELNKTGEHVIDCYVSEPQQKIWHAAPVTAE